MIKRSSLILYKNIKCINYSTSILNNINNNPILLRNYIKSTTSTATTTTYSRNTTIKINNNKIKRKPIISNVNRNISTKNNNSIYQELIDVVHYLQSLEITINNQNEKKNKLDEIDSMFENNNKSIEYNKAFSSCLGAIINLNLEFNNSERSLKYLNHFNNCNNNNNSNFNNDNGNNNSSIELTPKTNTIYSEIYHCFHSILLDLINNKIIKQEEIFKVLYNNSYLLKDYIKSKNFMDLLKIFNNSKFIKELFDNFLILKKKENPNELVLKKKEILPIFIHYYLEINDIENAKKLNQQYKKEIENENAIIDRITKQDISLIYFKFIEYYYKTNNLKEAINQEKPYKVISSDVDVDLINEQHAGGAFIIYQSLFELSVRNNDFEILDQLIKEMFNLDWKQIPFLIFYNHVRGNGNNEHSMILKSLSKNLKELSRLSNENKVLIIDSLIFMLLRHNSYDKVLHWVSYLATELKMIPSYSTIKNISNYHYFRIARARVEARLKGHWYSRLNDGETLLSLKPSIQIIKPHSPFRILELINEFTNSENKSKALGGTNVAEYLYYNLNYQSIYQFKSDRLINYNERSDSNSNNSELSTESKSNKKQIDYEKEEFKKNNEIISSDIYDTFDISTSFKIDELDVILKECEKKEFDFNHIIEHLNTKYFLKGTIPPGEQLLISVLAIKRKGHQYYKQLLEISPEYIKVLTFDCNYLSSLKLLEINEFLEILSLESQFMVYNSSTALNALLYALLTSMKIDEALKLTQLMIDRSIPIREHKTLASKLYYLMKGGKIEADLNLLNAIIENQSLHPDHPDSVPIFNCILFNLVNRSNGSNNEEKDLKEAFKLYHLITYKDSNTFNIGVKIYAKLHPHVGYKDIKSFIHLWDTLLESSKLIYPVNLFDFYEEFLSIFYRSGLFLNIVAMVKKNPKILRFASINSIEIILKSFELPPNTQIDPIHLLDTSNDVNDQAIKRANEIIDTFFKCIATVRHKFFPNSILEILMKSNQLIDGGHPKFNKFLENYKPQIQSVKSQKAQSELNLKNKEFLSNLINK